MLLDVGVVVAVALAVYCVLILLIKSRPRYVGYDWFWSNVLHAVTPSTFNLLTVGHWTFTRVNGYTPTDQELVHEGVHVVQFDAAPFMMYPDYFWQMFRKGYACVSYEIKARKAAGQPALCAGQG